MTPTASTPSTSNHRLPADLLEDIIDLLALETPNKRHLILAHVALVSRLFLHRCQSHLFREVTLRAAANRDHENAIFEASPHLLDYVQNVKIVGRNRVLSENTLWLLRHFHRLRKLHFFTPRGFGSSLQTEMIQVTPELVETIGSSAGIEEPRPENVEFRLSTLLSFSNLRELYVIHKGPSSPLPSLADASKVCLPKLRTLAILTPAIESQTGVNEFVDLISGLECKQLERVIWQSVNSFFRKPTFLDPHFTLGSMQNMFGPHANHILSLEIEQCTTVDLGFPGKPLLSSTPQSNIILLRLEDRTHPWTLSNLPRLRNLTFHTLDTTGETPYPQSTPHYVHFSWLIAMVNSLTTPHPLESIRLLIGYRPGETIHPEFRVFERVVECKKEMLPSLCVVEFVHLDYWNSPVDQAEWDTFARACLPGFARDGMLGVGIPSVRLSG
ncbi:hypothetical protein DL96DRAFT_1558529 [Flagelloscypha sp. PMI_526]|nr:hypothetical protein DL96DRAFT_1558529 [Flagelloscypha sp. PMI_526]